MTDGATPEPAGRDSGEIQLRFLGEAVALARLEERGMDRGAGGKAPEQCRIAGDAIIAWHLRALADSERSLIRNVKNAFACKPFRFGTAWIG